MTVLDQQTRPAETPRAGWRTPSFAYRLISSPALRAVLGWDRPRRDVRMIDASPGTTCLEVGSGGGFYTGALKEHLGEGSTLIALDPAEDSLEALRARIDHRPGAEVRYLAGDGCRLSLPDESVDTLFYGYSLEEMPDPLAAVREAHRVLRPGGELVLFLWRPVIMRARRKPVTGLLDSLLNLEGARRSPQNIRLRYRKSLENAA